MKRSYRSERNGNIRVGEHGEVFVEEWQQTSARYGNLWADAFARIEVPRDSARVLMLGLAGGGAIAAIKDAYPQAAITVVEYDPVMVEIASQLGTAQGVDIVTSDALDALTAFPDTFDVILVDIFEGMVPSPLLLLPEFWGAVGRRLAERGVAVVNVAGSPEFLEVAESLFSHSTTWRYDTNVFGAFWNHHS